MMFCNLLHTTLHLAAILVHDGRIIMKVEKITGYS
jgi:hypothetical protein